MARYNLYKNGDFVNSIEADLMFTMAFCQSQGLTYEEIPSPSIPIIPTPTPTEIASGTYTGTGLYGESNPNSVRPNIQAKVLMIFQNDQTLLTLSRAEATDEPFTWSASSAKEQCNENGLIYNWIAIS